MVRYCRLFNVFKAFSCKIGDKECVKSRLRDSAYSSFKQVSRISDKNLSREDAKALNNLVKNKDLYDYISKLNKILEDTPKFKSKY